MNKQLEFEEICDRVANIFFELETIIITIRDNFIDEHTQDPRLSMDIVDSSLKVVSSRANAFLGYKQRKKTDWTLEKYIKYSKERILSFFREFDNPFLGSEKWTPRIQELLIKLSAESKVLGSLLESSEET